MKERQIERQIDRQIGRQVGRQSEKEREIVREINHLSLHQWLRSAIPDSQQTASPIGFLCLKLPPPPCAVLLVYNIIIYIYTVKMKVRMPPRIPNIPPPQLECGPRTAKNPSVRMPPHPGFKFFCFWRTLCTNPSLRMPSHYEYHQMLECSQNASPLKLLSTSISAIRTLPP